MSCASRCQGHPLEALPSLHGAAEHVFHGVGNGVRALDPKCGPGGEAGPSPCRLTSPEAPTRPGPSLVLQAAGAQVQPAQALSPATGKPPAWAQKCWCTQIPPGSQV